MIGRLVVKRAAPCLRATRGLSLLQPVRACLPLTRSYSGRVESNDQTETNRAEKTLEKFWEKVTVKPDEGAFTVCLDTKPIKTPKGNTLTVPQATLAHLIHQEWSVITGNKILPHSLPMTSLVARAIDIADDQPERIRIISHLLPYLDTDTMLILSPDSECEGNLRKAQDKLYPEVKLMAELFWGTKLSSLDGNVALYGNVQSDETKGIVTKWMESLDHWQLAALERTTIIAKSLLAGMLTITHKRSVDQISDLVNLEAIHQTELWGEVEDTHDVNHVDMRRFIGSAYLLAAASPKPMDKVQLGL
uniref:ARAD1D32824p n=1 Tax=Blastobotrys adeninivorans TaxID=409370 RepID=A0A060TB74_BLAAD